MPIGKAVAMEFVGAILLVWLVAGIAVVLVLNAAKWLVRRHAATVRADLDVVVGRAGALDGRPLPRPLPHPVRPIVARNALTRPVPATPEL